MKILILSRQFPNNIEPIRGIFLKEEVLVLGQQCSIKVIAPVSWHPLMVFTRQGRRLLKISSKEIVSGIEVFHPRCIAVPLISRPINWLFYFLRVLFLLRNLKKIFNPQIFYIHFAYPDGVAGVLLAKLFKKPAIVVVRGSDINIMTKSLFTRFMIKYSLKNASQIMSVSNDLTEKVLRLGVKKEKIITIPRGVDFEKFSLLNKECCRKYLEVPLNKKIILYVGSLIKIKGVNTLVEAMKHLNEDYPDLVLVILGSGVLVKKLKKQVEINNLKHVIKFYGQILHKDMPQWLNACDLLCLPSHNEGTPTIILESLACGVPVVASNVGGIPEIIKNGKNGFIVNPKAPIELKKAILDCLQKEWDSEFLRRTVVDYNWDVVISQVVCEFEKMGGK